MSPSEHSHVTHNLFRRGSRLRARNSTDLLVKLLTALSRAGVLTVICLAPWWLGGVEPDIQFWIYTGLLISLATWLAGVALQSLTGSASGIALPTVLLPILAALLLGTFQLWPVAGSSSVGLEELAASAAQLRDPADPAFVPSAKALLPTPFADQSIYPAATRLEMARLVMAIIAVYLGTVLFASDGAQIWLWACLALNGAALSFFGIAQQLSWNGKLFGTMPLSLGGAPFASYVNRNNAAGCLNLCLAAAFGLVFTWLSRAQPEAWPGMRRMTSFTEKIRRGLDDAMSLDGRQAVILAISGLIAAGIVCSLSRGGGLAMVVATLAVCGLLTRTGRGVRIAALLVGMGVLSTGLMAWTGQLGRIGTRWETVSGDTIGADARLANWKDALKAARDFPVTGTGFGTYRYAYLPYQTWPAQIHFDNADNQFMEALVEGGWVGVSLILLCIALSLAASLALARSAPVDAAAVVGLFTIISQCVSAAFDFGPTLSANMLTFAVLIGAVAGRAARNIGTNLGNGWLALPVLRPAWMTALIGMALLAQGYLGLGQVSAASATRVASRDLPRLDTEASMSETSLAEAISQLELAVSQRPDDAEAHRALANLWIYRYRLQTGQALEENAAVSGVPADWNLTNPAVLYVQVQEWIRDGESAQAETACESSEVRENLVPAYQHLLAAQRACPLMPEIDMLLAMLSIVDQSAETTGEAHLRRALLISPGDPELSTGCGALAQAAGLTPLAHSCFRRAMELAPDRLRQIRPLWSSQVSLEQEIESILPASPELLLSLASDVYAGDEQRESRQLLVDKAQLLLASGSQQMTDSQRLHALARASALSDQPDAAIDDYRKLLTLEPLKTAWRLELVELLRRKGDYQAALDQAELCQAMAPAQADVREQVTSLRQLALRQPSSKPHAVNRPPPP